MSAEVERYIVEVNGSSTLPSPLGRLGALVYASELLSSDVAPELLTSVVIRETRTDELRASWVRTHRGWNGMFSPGWL